MNAHVVLAVFRRNFVSYFSSPIGYVFICAFVLLTAFAAFWPNDFFNANLANLDQLNRYLPWIMLVFIPAITMTIWAEERRQGTDELLLTLPGNDLDVVVGKFLAALSIYTVSLLFSVSNIIVLKGLGRPDIGLLIGNYVGYWLVGAAMVSIGMVASFLTNNLTVGFILAAVFNAPLIFAAWAGDIVPFERLARLLQGASIEEQFRDFGRGVISLSGIVFFLSIIAVNLYLSMVLIGRRHWVGGVRAPGLAMHFTLRALALIAVAIGVNVLVQRFDIRVDTSAEKLSSLSPRTRELLDRLDPARPVYVQAYVSPTVPEQYVQTRLNLLSMLREVDARAGDKVVVQIKETRRFSEEEAEAQQQFGIMPRSVQSSVGGKIAVDQIVLGIAFTSGLDKIVVPFVDRGVPVEYEVVRSIATISDQKRKRLGVVSTDAKLYGGFDIESMSNRPDQAIITELQKQYEMAQVDARSPITEKFDVLLAVQPSSLTAVQLENLVAAIRSGQPTAILEDPFPIIDQSVPGTSEPRRPPGRNPFMQQPPPEPKGDITALWHMLGVDYRATEIIWQDYNPYPNLPQLDRQKELLFISTSAGTEEAFNNASPITSGLQQIVMAYAAALRPIAGSTLTFTPLMKTSDRSGVVMYGDIIQRDFLGRTGLNPNRRLIPTRESYTVAAKITGEVVDAKPQAAEGATAAASKINVVVVSDIDVLQDVFFQIRAQGRNEEAPVDFQFDNVAFILNILDDLAEDDRFLDIRKRRPVHRTLTAVERRTEVAKTEADQQRKRFVEQFESKQGEEQQKLQAKIEELQQRQGVDPQQMLIEVATAQRVGETRLQAAVNKLQQERDRETEKIERDLALKVRRVQDRYKFTAIAWPPIPPLILAAIVFFRRRSLERMNIPSARRK